MLAARMLLASMTSRQTWSIVRFNYSECKPKWTSSHELYWIDYCIDLFKCIDEYDHTFRVNVINIINLLINLLHDRDIHETKFVDFLILVRKYLICTFMHRTWK